LLNASVGVQRVLGRVRRNSTASIPAMTIPTALRVPSRAIRKRYGYPAASRHLYPLPHRRHRRIALPAFLAHPSLTLTRSTLRSMPVVLRRTVHTLGHERVVAIAAAGILLSASFLSVSPGGPSGDTGGPTGDGPGPRLAIGGSSDGNDTGSVEEAYVGGFPRGADERGATDSTHPDLLPPTELDKYGDPVNKAGVASLLGGPTNLVDGPFLDDGTLLKPVAVDTTVPDGSELMRSYKVKSGDTLATIAHHFDVSMMTLWWANDLKSKDRLVVGQELRIPPVSGLVVEVTPVDTLASLARHYRVDQEAILATNGLEDENLVVGQVLMLPGARGDNITPPKTHKRHSVSSPVRPQVRPHHDTRTTVRPPHTYNGGRMLWPTTSHHISQYFHYGHYAIDIDGSTGDPIFAAASGTVTFAGWKNNGGGYQVWIAHGSGLYTTYNHMSGVSVGRGQTVGRGQRVGRMGATGNATGSHLHFEVWRGPIWGSGHRVNPLPYL
jgi:murein DD-endopeptidase MepM/ murein hydrolase activator NlpD